MMLLMGGVELTFSQYKNLLLSATAAYDAKLGLSQPRSLRRTQEHSWTDSSAPDEASFDIDTDVTELSAFAARRSFPGTPRHRLSREQWRALSASDRSIWDQLPNASKAIILGTSLAPSASAPTPVPAPADPPHRRLNLHDISAADYLDILSIHKLAFNPDNGAPAPPTATPDATPAPPTVAAPSAPSSILAMATKRTSSGSSSRTQAASTTGTSSSPLSTASPGDIRRVLGNVHRITYKISAHRAHTFGSLVDRGANGGLAGDDVRIVHKSEHPRTVDVSGIDNHEITGLPIVTVGGVVQSQRGPVIAIMHQYAYTGQGKTIHSSAQLEWFQNKVRD